VVGCRCQIGGRVMAPRNITPEDSAADLEAAFAMALSDALKADKVASSVLEVARKTIEDHRAQRRWEAEQESLSRQAAPVVAPGDTGEATTTTPPRVLHGIELDKLPFKVKSKGVEVPPKSTEADDTDKPTSWAPLSSQPFMSPEN
jgi:hypothetical protein